MYTYAYTHKHTYTNIYINIYKSYSRIKNQSLKFQLFKNQGLNLQIDLVQKKMVLDIFRYSKSIS